MIKIMYAEKRRKPGWKYDRVECSAEEWSEAFANYSPAAARHIANLAAHKWCVAIVDGRCLISGYEPDDQSSHWVEPDGSKAKATAAQLEPVLNALAEAIASGDGGKQ